MRKLGKGKNRYEILVEGMVRWKGNHPEKALPSLSKKYPKAKISVRWKPGKEILIAVQNLSVPPQA